MAFLSGGAGGVSPSATSGASSGDVSSGLDFSLATNNSFTVGGSGGFSSGSDASGASRNPNANANVAAIPPSQMQNNMTPLLIGGGVIVVGLTALLLTGGKRSKR